MGTLLTFRSDLTLRDMCGIDSDTSDVAQLAIDGDEKALRELHPKTLVDTLHALDVCSKCECRAHGREDDARDLLDSIWTELVEREEEEREKHERGCDRCGGGGCNVCLGLSNPTGAM